MMEIRQWILKIERCKLIDNQGITVTDVLDISDIKLISTIVEEGSINKASERLNVSQPTLSKRLGRLEEKLGLELFYRDSSGMVPTEAARYLQTAATGLENQISAVSRQIQLMSNKSSGHVSIGVGPIVEQLFVPKVLLDFAEAEHPFSVRIHVDSAENLLDALRHGNLDLAIGPFSLEEASTDLKEVLSHSEPCTCVMRHGHKLANKRSISLTDVKSHKLISAAVPASMAPDIDNIAHGQLEPNIVYNSFAMAKNIVSNSNYLTIGPASMFYREILNEELIAKPLEDQPLWTCRCFVKPEVQCIPIVQEMIGLFGQYMEENLHT
ncbi:LysR family transcriptional regulator [Pseudoteredinibacter isoporae]|uniref:DNA-binding transcriptional LysR family regulator n=1 Tax=Pseudoteredinibacter isoporae TaxID=570281 RepID=A0A7X0MUH5_9GAMM|nr:LysR family transcriptional regulator [Pseudoteredinibacter isoporae]MBB6520636.1 DNA-binding transcriptional LysR family regulator [Pseudoteredinibacter isoporae]NHO86203.1 LysR family transcriptional regulator [Pseudoteredinibacter isoporae]NIB25346.1 LysR family transcriptional regulator [Pseudoteredinibacter isoporae]